MPGLFQIFVCTLGAFLALGLVRRIWRRAQVRQAVKLGLIPAQARIGRISGLQPFIGCGSVLEAFRQSLVRRFYSVTCHLPDGEVRQLEFSAVFGPFSGRLRKLEPFPGAGDLPECSSGNACPTGSL